MTTRSLKSLSRPPYISSTEGVSIDRCKLIAVLGIGGIGKTALATKLGQQLQDGFEYVIWLSCSVDGSIKVWELHNYTLVEVHSIESSKPYQMMKLGGNQGLNRAQLTSLVQLGAELAPQI